MPQQGRPAITYPAYRAFIQYMLDNDWHAWFNRVIIWGELLIGLRLLVGGLTAITAFFGLLMNFSFLFAGSASSNPILVILRAVIIFGWRIASWWGLDRLLLPRLGTPREPGGHGHSAHVQVRPTAGTRSTAG